MTKNSSPSTLATQEAKRLRLTIRGAVQGVGFRPFIYRLAKELNLHGYVGNTSQGVIVDVEQSQEALSLFLKRLPLELPPRAFIQSMESSYLDTVQYQSFDIRVSDDAGSKSALVLPDIATCPKCLKDIFDLSNRRYLYPFTNCTNCGPRYSIIESLPYDRAHTTMKRFVMCELCRHEYEDPADRRFHAQPNACPVCGPHLELWDSDGHKLTERHEALLAAGKAIREGQILAVKGLGGFHLMVDAEDEKVVQRLRQRKGRVGKPLAVMYPDLEQVMRDCDLSDVEQRIILSVEAPITLVRKKSTSGTAEAVAPNNPYLGVMLPYTPLHHLLLRELNLPVVATSGNLAEEPICIDEHEAVTRLAGIADSFLVHDRPIRRHVDDSIVRAMAGREQVMRRARGYAPLPITLTKALPPLVAVGAHLKNTVAISLHENVFISQHIGDLETVEAHQAFQDVLGDLWQLYDHQPEAIIHDLHPDYLSTQWATNSGQRRVAVQHHYAHILSCMAENEIVAPALGIAWDGAGYGADGTIWGGEFLLINSDFFVRSARLRPFSLPGGDKAVREPRRSALGVLYKIYGDDVFQSENLMPPEVFTSEERRVMQRMLQNGINSPRTSSAGRLFDAISSILGLCQKATFEGEAAMQVEFAADGVDTDESYPFEIVSRETIFEIDWQQMIARVIDERNKQLSRNVIAARFQNTLVEMIVTMAKQIGETKVALSGGCFQNKSLTERSVRRLREEGFSPYWHQRVPPNDGGIALGQIVAAARQGLKE